MKSIYIYPHLGMGDEIVVNGIVRSYAETYDKVFVFSKPKNIKNVIYMYRDNPKIYIIGMEDYDVKRFMDISPINNYLIVGHDKLFKKLGEDSKSKFDQIFYDMADVPFENKWNKFYLQRDIEKEKDVFYNKLGLTDDSKFIFVHEDKERPMQQNKLPRGIKIIKPDRLDISIFDYLYTIEKAQEVHVIDSSFFNLIECIQLRNEGLFFHKYVRISLTGEGGTPTFKLKWVVL